LSYEDDARLILAHTHGGGDMGNTQSQLPFFVYGTLLPGQPNYGYWRGGVLAQQPALLPEACLFDRGNYPMLIENRPGTVRGLAITVFPSLYPAILAALDTLEGYDPSRAETAEYRRERRVIQLLNGLPVVAWVYVGQPDQMDDLPQAGGDWKQYARTRQREIDSWWQASGR